MVFQLLKLLRVNLAIIVVVIFAGEWYNWVMDNYVFSIEEVMATLQGMATGLRSGGLDQEQIRPLVISNVRDYVNRGWLSPDDTALVFDKLGIDAPLDMGPPLVLGTPEKVTF